MFLTRSIWGECESGDVFLYTLQNGNTKVMVSNYGAIINSISCANDEEEKNIVLAYESLQQYIDDQYYLGCIVGRVANRVADGGLPVKEKLYQLSLNEPANNNHIHGGFSGFNKKLFEIKHEKSSDEVVSVVMQYISPHLEEGYPGNLKLEVEYALDKNENFHARFRASSDVDTHVNITQHTYFSLGGDAADHQLRINSEAYLETNERFLPTGKMMDVAGSRYDFTDDKMIMEPGAYKRPVYNAYYFLSEKQQPVAPIKLASREISVEIFTSYPGVLLYTGDYLDNPFKPYSGICLECQLPPDAVHHQHLPTTLLNAGEYYDQYITYHFNWNK